MYVFGGVVVLTEPVVIYATILKKMDLSSNEPLCAIMISLMPSARVFLPKVDLTIDPEKVVGMKLYCQTIAPVAAFNLANT
jgi:hypothetical protein